MMRARVIARCRTLLSGGMLRHGCGYRAYTGAAAAEVAAEPPSEKVLEVVDEVCGLNLMEMCELSELLRTKHNINDIPIMSMGMPGIGVPVPYMDIPLPGMGVGADSGAGVVAPVEAEVEKQAEKSVFDIKLEGYDASAKIKIIKEVRSFTDLGLKEAKELVEKAPSLLKQGVAKEQAEQILAKLKEMGAKVSLE